MIFLIKKDKNNIILTTNPQNIIIAELKNKEACLNYQNCISGSFQHQNKANCILINRGNVFGNISAHGWLGFPDSCLIFYKQGVFAIKRLISIPEEDLKNIEWAVSGMGLLSMYAPALEGYTKNQINGKIYDYSDVLRKTNHTVIGVKDGTVYGIYLKSMTAEQVNKYCKEMNLDFAVMLDGGSIAAANTDLATENQNQKQHNIIQFVQSKNEKFINEEKFKICIDAGHGGSDPGALGKSGTKEKDINLDIALLVEEKLLKNNIEVVMTRDADVKKGKLSISERCKIANNANVDYVVSIHNNADGDKDDKTGHGIETWICSKNGEAYSLAQAIQKKLVKATGLFDRGVKVKGFGILTGTKAPAVLIETGFINNSKEEKLLKDKAFQNIVADAIVEGIVEYINRR